MPARKNIAVDALGKSLKVEKWLPRVVIIKKANNKKMLAKALNGYFKLVDFIVVPLNKLTAEEIKVSKIEH